MEIKINEITRQQIKTLAIKNLHIIGKAPFDNVTPLDGDYDEMRNIGRGTFYHYGLKMKSYERVIDTRFSMADPRPVIFNDRLPHNFIATMNCAALLFAIRAKKLSEISLDIIP